MLTAGFATVDITPALGSDMPGGFSPRHATGVLDPLGVHACVIEDEVPFACVGVDAVSLPAAVLRSGWRKLAGRCPLPYESLLVAASHTHCGGPAHAVLGTDADPAYQERISEAIAEAVAQAWEQRVPATFAAGSAACPGLAFNRRWLMRHGGEATNPGKRNADAIRPAGPADDEVAVLACHGRDGKLLGCIGNFACHSTVIWGDRFSGDYSAYWREALGAPLVFLNGACGDINQIDFSNPDSKESGVEHARQMGRALAEATARALAGAERRTTIAIGQSWATLRLALRVPAPEQQAEDAELVRVPQAEWTSRHWQARDRLLLVESLADRDFLECDVALHRVGPAVLPAAPWQPFCEFGLRLKRDIRAAVVLPAILANGNIGYVPTPQAFIGGGYEPTLCRGSKLQPEAGDRICEALVGLAERDGR
ncbi:MAG: hypothetical protein RBU25_08105 [Lentisphaeria bacterium]|jgi:hypothetical protein|nr:hypothetical protein [Lentisphaeria bacterium]